MVDYNYYTAVGIALLAIIAIVLSKQWFMTGIKIFIGNSRFKGNAGAIFLRTVGSDFAPPVIVDLRSNFYQDKKRTIHYSRDMFKEGRFMGVPYCFKDSEDDKTSLGIHKLQTDEAGNTISIPFTLTLNGKEEVLTQPVITPIKSSVSLSPELTKSVINGIALTQVVKDFIDKNKILLLVAGASVLVGVIGAYFGYVNNNLISSACQTGINQLSGQIQALQFNVTGVVQ